MHREKRERVIHGSTCMVGKVDVAGLLRWRKRWNGSTLT
jgi:hypothetical protein